MPLAAESPSRTAAHSASPYGTINEVLRAASRSYDCAMFGYETLAAARHVEDRNVGLITSVVFGRAVLPTLDGLRALSSAYESFAAPLHHVRCTDGLVGFVERLRTYSFVRGSIAGTSTTIASPVQLAPTCTPVTVDPETPLPGAVVSFVFDDPPRAHLGKPLETNDVGALVETYLAWVWWDVLRPALCAFAEGAWGRRIRAEIAAGATGAHAATAGRFGE